MAGIEGSRPGRACVIGAGSSGIVTVKVLSERGLRFTGFELGSDIGGIWRYGNDSGRSPAYASLETNTSDARTAYRSFPIDRGSPRYLHHSELLSYLEAFADRFGVRRHIRFRTRVERVTATDEGFQVTARDLRTGALRSGMYAHVIVCTGHHWDARLPEAAEAFGGVAFHSREYRTPRWPEGLAGNRVGVVGIGNSACDIVCEVSEVAARTILSTRRGAHVLPKELFGRPLDRWITPLSSRLPTRWQARILDLLVRLDRGDQRRFGIPRPDHRLDGAHPTLSRHLPDLVRAGRIEVRPDIASFEGRRVLFSDGSEEELDVLIFATGYHISFPFLSDALLDRIDPPGRASRENGRIADNRIRLYRHVVPPDAPGLFFLGLVQPLGAIPPLAEAQAEWIADLIEGVGDLPPAGRMWREIEATERQLEKRFVASRRHTLEVDVFPYRRALERERRRGRRRRRLRDDRAPA